MLLSVQYFCKEAYMYIYVYFLHIWILYFILFSTSTVSSANVVCMLCRQAVAGGEQAWHLGTLLYHHILPVCRRRQASKQADRLCVRIGKEELDGDTDGRICR